MVQGKYFYIYRFYSNGGSNCPIEKCSKKIVERETSWQIMVPRRRVQKRPAKESAIKAPMRGNKLVTPAKIVRVLAAFTMVMFSSFVRYVIMFAAIPTTANLSHTSFTASMHIHTYISNQTQSMTPTSVKFTYNIACYIHVYITTG